METEGKIYYKTIVLFISSLIILISFFPTIGAASGAWTGETWEGKTWTGPTWEQNPWDGNTWEGKNWEIDKWNGTVWTSDPWNGKYWDGKEWKGNPWEGNTWNGALWTGKTSKGTVWEAKPWQANSWEWSPWVVETWQENSWEGNPWESETWQANSWEGSPLESEIWQVNNRISNPLSDAVPFNHPQSPSVNAQDSLYSYSIFDLPSQLKISHERKDFFKEIKGEIMNNQITQEEMNSVYNHEMPNDFRNELIKELKLADGPIGWLKNLWFNTTRGINVDVGQNTLYQANVIEEFRGGMSENTILKSPLSPYIASGNLIFSNIERLSELSNWPMANGIKQKWQATKNTASLLGKLAVDTATTYIPPIVEGAAISTGLLLLFKGLNVAGSKLGNSEEQIVKFIYHSIDKMTTGLDKARGTIDKAWSGIKSIFT